MDFVLVYDACKVLRSTEAALMMKHSRHRDEKERFHLYKYVLR